MSTTQTNTADLAGLLKPPHEFTVDGIQHIALPPGWTMETLDKNLREPRRIKAHINAHDVRGFIDYLEIFAAQDITAIYAGPRNQPKLEARIDDHTPGMPSHVTHKATYACPLTHEWQQWIGYNNKPMSQVAFAEFVENNIGDVVAPTGTELLNACLTFQDTGSVEFNSAIRLGDGRVQFKYIEKDESKELKFPERVSIGIPVFEGMTGRFPIEAKLRYRIDKEKGLELRYILERPDIVLNAAYEALMTHVSDATGLRIIRAI